MNAAVLELIKKSAAVPSMPQVVTRFLDVMQDPSFDYRDLAKVLSTDPGTVSEILRLCNSALFGLRQRVASLQQALTLLGPKRTRSLLLGRYLVDALAQKPAAGLDMVYFWRRSLTTAVVSARMAGVVIPRMKEETFCVGLLADIGIPILAEALGESFIPVVARFGPCKTPMTADEERKTVGASHGEVSAMVLAHWTLPEAVHRPVNLHQSANPGSDEIGTIARIVNGGDRISRLLCEGSDPATIVSVCTAAVAFARADLQGFTELLPAIETDIHELATVLRMDVIPNRVYSLVVKTLKEHLGLVAAPSA